MNVPSCFNPAFCMTRPDFDYFDGCGCALGEKGVPVYHEDSFFGAITVSSYRFGSALEPGYSTERK
jgi:hypothetical protein